MNGRIRVHRSNQKFQLALNPASNISCLANSEYFAGQELDLHRRYRHTVITVTSEGDYLNVLQHLVRQHVPHIVP